MRLSFDNGTIVISDTTNTARPAELAGVLFDPRIGQYRAPAWRYSELVTTLRRHATEFTDQVCQSQRRPGIWDTVALRPYQQAALCSWEMAGRRGVVALPTGSGKTRVAVAAMAALGTPVLCLVPTRVLLHQWREELRQFYHGPVGCWGDGQRCHHPIAVATFESAYRHMAKIGADFQLLVVDEVHHFGLGVRDEALEMAIAPARLGLSATPPEDPVAADRVSALVGPTVYELRVEQLTGTYLAHFDLVVLRLRLDQAERRQYEREVDSFKAVFRPFMRAMPYASWADFVSAASRTAEGRTAMAAWRRSRRMLGLTRAKAAALEVLLARHRDSRLLIFTADNETAYEIAKRYLVMPLTCDIKRKERERVLASFRCGELKALVSARVLNEGLDVPDADVAIIVGSSLGPREHVQRIGRLLRPSPGKHAMVYELVTQATTETRTASRRRRDFAPTATLAF